MKHVYMVMLKQKDGLLLFIEEFENISDCNPYFKNDNYRIVDAWKKI